MPANLENSRGHRTGKDQFSFQSQRRAVPKNAQTTAQLYSSRMVKRLPTRRETWIQSLGREDLLEKEMATHSSIFAWKIPWTEKSVLILCRPLLPPSIFPNIRVFSNESVLYIRWPKNWSFSFNMSLPVNTQD